MDADARRTYTTNSYANCKISILKSNLCHYRNVYICLRINEMEIRRATVANTVIMVAKG